MGEFPPNNSWLWLWFNAWAKDVALLSPALPRTTLAVLRDLHSVTQWWLRGHEIQEIALGLSACNTYTFMSLISFQLPSHLVGFVGMKTVFILLHGCTFLWFMTVGINCQSCDPHFHCIEFSSTKEKDPHLVILQVFCIKCFSKMLCLWSKSLVIVAWKYIQ